MFLVLPGLSGFSGHRQLSLSPELPLTKLSAGLAATTLSLTRDLHPPGAGSWILDPGDLSWALPDSSSLLQEGEVPSGTQEPMPALPPLPSPWVNLWL